MNRHPLELLIEKADSAINREDFDALIDLHSDDAVLVIKPGMNATVRLKSERHSQPSPGISTTDWR